MGHVAYQIKANDTCSNMVANLSHSFDFDPTQGVKGTILKFVITKADVNIFC